MYVRTSLRACRWPRTKRTRCCWCCIKTGCDSVGSIVHHPRLKRADDESCSGAFSFIDSPHHHDHSWNCHLLCITTGVFVAPGGSLVGIAFAYTVPIPRLFINSATYTVFEWLLCYGTGYLSCPVLRGSFRNIINIMRNGRLKFQVPLSPTIQGACRVIGYRRFRSRNV